MSTFRSKTAHGKGGGAGKKGGKGAQNVGPLTPPAPTSVPPVVVVVVQRSSDLSSLISCFQKRPGKSVRKKMKSRK